MARRIKELEPEPPVVLIPDHYTIYYVEVAGALRRALINNRAPKARVLAAFQQLQAAPLRRAQVRPLRTEAWALKDNITLADAV